MGQGDRIPPDKQSIYEASNRIYDAAIAAGTDRFERVLGHDMHRQYFRFAEIRHFMGDLGTPDLSVLDVGCGNGEFLNYLNFCGFAGRYLGVDINDRMLAEARESYPPGRFERAEFRKGDILAEAFGHFDYVVASGVFNIESGQNDGFLFEIFKRMAAQAKHKTILNAVTTYVNFRDPKMYYIDPARMLDFIIRNISPRVELRHHFLPYNYTVCIHANSAWTSVTAQRNANR